MKIVFFGTPPYVLPVLETLHKTFKQQHESPITAVVTQKPKPSGRKKLLKYSAIDQWAHERNKPKYFSSRELLENKVEADIGILAAYGEIIPKEVIEYFPNGILNVHPSLLPQFRGASPVQATLVTGQKEAGVSIIRMDQELDHGPIVSQFKEEIFDSDTTESLRNRSFLKASEVLTTLIPAYISGKIKPRTQDHKEATFTKLIRKADAFIDPNILSRILEGKNVDDKWDIPFMIDYSQKYSSESINNFIRAMNPWPIAWTEVVVNKNEESKRLKLISSHLEGGELVLDEVQLEGKNPVSWKQFTSINPKFRPPT